MNNTDRKAFEEACKKAGLPTRMRNGAYAEHDTRHFLSGWLAARDHYRQQVMELVELVEAVEVCRSPTPVKWTEEDGPIYRFDLYKMAEAYDLAAKLKEQHDNG